MKEFLEDFDHELSLVSAVAFLCLFGYSGFICQTFVLNRLFRRGQVAPVISKTQALRTIVFLFLVAELPTLWLQPRDGLADLIKGTDPRLDEILERVPGIQRGPKAPLMFGNRHITFFPWLIQNEIHRLEGIPFQRLDVQVSDCTDKQSEGCDPLTAETMTDIITLDVFPPFDENSPYAEGFNSSSPIIYYAPGLRCHAQDIPGNSIIRRAYAQGFRSIVVNRRGHTPDLRLQSPRWNLFGDVDDLEQVYWHIKKNWVSPDTPMFLYGISSGTAVTVTSLAKWDRRRVDEPDRPTPSFVASADVTPGYDISKVLRRDRFLFPYNDLLLAGVKDHFVVKNEAVLRQYDSAAVDKLLAANSLQEVVDAGARFAGYETIEEYYEDINPINEMRDITTPKLVLNARDDPCCQIGNLYETSPYPHHENKTYAEMIAETENGMVAVSWTGSHCPFLCTRGMWLPFVKDPFSGGWMLNSWSDETVIDYFLAALDVYHDRRFL
eukprot:Nitzschia sp. Nitz4//scaffold144_size56818//23871//25355//NITZ4_006534-RA/size56818-processed-gene-0.81-mRNA-1//-1//CDS//3329536507//9409//frame0